MSNDQVKPVFIFSLPRSGSTLTQRVLAAHELAATVSEPWVLLPLMYSMRFPGVFAEYNHHVMTLAIGDLMRELPNHKVDYYEAIRVFALNVYSRLCNNGEIYFIDKTPRYHIISQDIVNAFPDGKFIFLWRNPLAVAASIIETWGHGKWSIYRFRIDLYDGLAALCETYQHSREKLSAFRYEDLVDSEKEWQRMFSVVGLNFDPAAVAEFTSTRLEGGMGDPTGTVAYKNISRAPLDKWRETMANPLRKRWCKKYLAWVGEERLALMGYDYADLKQQIDGIPFSMRYLFSDLLCMPLGFMYCLLEPYVLIQKFKSILKRRYIHVHR
jgi:hypothetical protein